MPHYLKHLFLPGFSCLSIIFALNSNSIAFDEKRILVISLLTLSLFFQSIFLTPHFKFLALSKNNFLSLTIILFLGVTSLTQAHHFYHALLEISSIIALLIYSFHLAQNTDRQIHKNSLIIVITLLITAFLYQIRFFSGFLASFIADIPLKWPEPFTGFSNVRFFNQYQIWSLALLPLSVILYPNLSGNLKKLVFMTACGWGLLFIAALSRGAFLSFAFAIILTWLIFRSHANWLLKQTLLTIAIGCLGYFLLFKWLPELLQNQSTSALRPVHSLGETNDRIQLWKIAIQHIIENPWLGIGPMHYAYYPGPTHAHPHNSVLQWAAEMGIPSTILVLYLAFSGLRAWVQKFYRLTRENRHYVSPHLWIALFCSLLSGMIYSLFSGVFVMPLSQLMFALIAGWMLGIYFYDVEPKPVKPVYVLAYKAFAGITLIALVYSVLPSLLPRLHNDYAELASKKYSVMAPRFWQLGGIPHD